MSRSAADPTSTDARYARIWRVVAAIPAGQVASYGQIAELAGIARGARQVGRALGKAPKDLKLPWFRVLQASGRIALAEDSDSYKRQRRHLLSEGVLVEGGRVSMRRYRWAPSEDEILLRF